MMETARFFLGFSLFVLLVVPSCGFPAKGSKSTDQSSGDQRTSFASHRGSQTSRSAPVQYRSRSGGVSQPVSVLVQSPASAPLYPAGAEYPVFSEAAQLSDRDPGFSQFGQTSPVTAGAAPPVMVVHEGAGSTQPGPPQAALPETRWAVDPPSFSERAADLQAVGSDFLPPVPPPPSGPVLQSGETSNIVKEAELGNYQQQTEEFGYPAEAAPAAGAAFTGVVVPGRGLGGVWGSPYPGFDYRLLYGLYPPGTYTTFSQNHEKGKDYHQSIHYLKEHVSEDSGPQQQQKVFHGQQLRS
ncbi:hypothetical protein OJAV_G00048480 [Oryzias javanicus]|uniref:Uncharacterized protein n=1 Tax=Oryzias javanicus TaxID=123683 RepID=A0A3S2Q804_ORYJA|nr:hypothetical protein OJAV_G00048480 [Oryzias javanicus]